MTPEGLAKLAPEQKRIRISELCGYTNVHAIIVKNVSAQGDDRNCGVTSDQGWIPDYLNDLNAIYEVEEKVPEELLIKYLENLIEINMADKTNRHGAYHTTAAQRADALLLTLG